MNTLWWNHKYEYSLGSFRKTSLTAWRREVSKSLHKLMTTVIKAQCVKAVRPKQNDRYFSDDIFKCIPLIKNNCVCIQLSHNFERARHFMLYCVSQALQWRHNGHDGVWNHQPQDCLLNRLFRRRSKKASKLRVTGLRAGNSRVTGEFPAQMASDAENVSIWWCHHGKEQMDICEGKYVVSRGIKLCVSSCILPKELRSIFRWPCGL